MLKLGNLFLTLLALAVEVLHQTDSYTTSAQERDGFPACQRRIALDYSKTSLRSPPGWLLIYHILLGLSQKKGLTNAHTILLDYQKG